MDTLTKVILLFIMYGLPVCAAFIYKLHSNIKEKRQLDNSTRFNPNNSLSIIKKHSNQ